MDVGTEIRRVREAKGWSQAKLAAGADMGVSGISQIETGARNPSVTTLSKIAEALGVGVAELFPKAQSPLPLEDASGSSRTLLEWLRAPGIPADELSDEDLSDIRRVLAGGKPRARFVDEGEDRALERLTAEASELAASELPALKRARERRGVSLPELAARVGMPVEDIAALEQGAQKADPATMRRLTAVLDSFQAELLFPPEQVEAFLAENEQQNELVREQVADMSSTEIRELVLRHLPLQRLVEAYRTAEHQSIRNETA